MCSSSRSRGLRGHGLRPCKILQFIKKLAIKGSCIEFMFLSPLSWLLDMLLCSPCPWHQPPPIPSLPLTFHPPSLGSHTLSKCKYFRTTFHCSMVPKFLRTHIKLNGNRYRTSNVTQMDIYCIFSHIHW